MESLKVYSWVLMTMVLSACGNSQLTATPGSSASGSSSQFRVAQGELPESAVVTDGALGPLSDYDLRVDPLIRESGLPFLSEVGFEKSFSTFKTPAVRARGKVKLKDGKELDFGRGTNLVFRAIHQVPPAEAIRGVKVFKLKLNGVRIHAKSLEQLFDGQSVCFLDGKFCFGEKPTLAASSEGSGGNPKFWSGHTLVSIPESNFSSFTEAEVESGSGTSTSDGKLFTSGSAGLEIDFLALLNGSSKAAVEFILKHSSDYSDAKAGYRKFRFSLGDRILADSGELILEWDLDSSKIPEDFGKRLAAPVHGASDMLLLAARTKDKPLRNAKGGLDSRFLRVFDELELTGGSAGSKPAEGLSDPAKEEIAGLGKKLEAKRDLIERIRLVGLNLKADQEDWIEWVKQELTAQGLSETQIQMRSTDDEGGSPAVGIEIEFKEQIEKDASARKKAFEELAPAEGELSKKNEDILDSGSDAS